MEVSTSSEAAELVLQERKKQRELEARNQKAPPVPLAAPALETVSVPKWEGADEGEVDESELDRRQRAISDRLDRRQREIHRQSKELTRVRAELKALEEPIKAEIMQLRERLEDSNRREKALVEAVNALRKDLFEKEGGLKDVREEKQGLADSLIKVMADYEKRKTERLNAIADLVGGDGGHTRPKHPPSNFTGF
ncbi:unnamed protein product [Chondrus crispus]|uniref:Uncharacterized protein n=1 Tax=Chondrus crispus TaxID=2769 RepID=R7Q9P5_CHOCR|nr:unnamed protein product [Chondrus crispus]CDF34784.1 unnamed protein product [Chondrus crispus]|eukprot:XP_005714603.1 unnamed protein product [Chondrus crispus]